MSQPPGSNRLAEEVARVLDPLLVSVRHEKGHFVAEIVKRDGTVVWPDFAAGSSELLAMLAAEQRFLVEQTGTRSEPGATYADKAKARLQRWLELNEG